MKHWALCGLIAAATPAYADNNARTIQYDPNKPETIVTNVKKMTTVTVGAGERISHMMFGDDGPDAPAGGPRKEELEASPLFSNAPIWGKRSGTTVATILTLMPDGFTERTYKFIIEVRPEVAGLDPQATYWLTVKYSQAEQYQANPAAKEAAQAVVAKRQETWKEKQERTRLEALEASLREDVHNGPQNYRYLAQGDPTIAPCYDCTWDNSRMTAFRLNPNTPAATIYVVDTPAHCDPTKSAPAEYLNAPDGRVAPATVRGDLTIMHETARHIRFRLGQKTTDIFNCGYDPVGAPSYVIRTAQQ